MCSPAVAAGVGLAALGTGFQLAGQSRAQRAQADVTRAETGRQSGYAAAGRDAVDQARRTWDNQPATTARAEGERRAALDAAAAGAATGGYLPGQSQAIRVETDRERGENATVIAAENAARASLNSWGDTLLTGRLASSRSGSEVGRQAGFARGSAAVLPTELQAAGTRGQTLRTLGDATMFGAMAVPGMVATRAPTWGSIFGSGPRNMGSFDTRQMLTAQMNRGGTL